MRLLPEIIDSSSAIQEIRRNIHAHPELRFEENRTSQLVAEALSSWGIEVFRGLGKTGVVGRLVGDLGPGKMIGLRADMDALPLQEHNTFSHSSQNPEKCMRVVMMVILPCFSEQQNTYPTIAISKVV